jgi:hypothetical protein
MAAPIAGIPYEEAEKIFKQHEEELCHLPGVKSCALSRGGIILETDNPAVVPASIEGLPVKTEPPRKRRFLSHTADSENEKSKKFYKICWKLNEA